MKHINTSRNAPSRAVFWLLIFCLLLVKQSVFAVVVPAYQMQAHDKAIEKIYKNIPNYASLNMGQRVAAISKFFLGKPYVLEPLGEGTRGRYDQMPLYRTDSFDCVTFVSTVMALANSNSLRQFKRTIVKMRYARSRISYTTRTHWFIQVDWNKNNHRNGYLTNITNQIRDQRGIQVAKIATAIIDKPNWYRYHKQDAIRLLKPVSAAKVQKLLQELRAKAKLMRKEKSAMLYLPLTRLFNKSGVANKYLFKQIPNGSVIEIVRPNWQIKQRYGTNLNVSHLGLAVRKGGELIFRHASSLQHSVVDIPLAVYLSHYLTSKTLKGIAVEKII